MSFVHAPSLSTSGARISTGLASTLTEYERRKTTRFPLAGQALYSVAGNQATAPVRDISSGGVFLKTDRILRVGKRIRVFIDWPVLLEDRCPLRLVIDGNVLRSDMSGTAVKLTKYEFRTRPTLVPQRISA